MILADLDTSTPELRSLHVFGTTSSSVIGALGRNIVEVNRSTDFTDEVLPGDIVELQRDASGFAWIAVRKIGFRDGDSLAQSSDLGLPIDFGQGDQIFQQQPYVAYSTLLTFPPALVLADDGDHSRVAYGWRGSTSTTTRVYYGRSLCWFDPNLEPLPPYRRLSLIPLAPTPQGLRLRLYTSHDPAEGPGEQVADVVEVVPQYRGPDVPFLVTLPDAWREAMTEGAAGSIGFEPSTTTPGLTSIAIGDAGSLSIHH